MAACVHCSNGGTCVFYGPETEDYTCRCPLGFRGRHCETVENTCESQFSKPCPPGARCISAPGTYYCRCPPGQTMLQFECVRKLNCADNPCQNGGSCFTVPGEHRDYKCQCNLGFQGVDCEKVILECTTNYCGPHGLCIATQTGPKCQCLSPYYGAKCEHISRHPNLLTSASAQNNSLDDTIRSYETLELFSVSAAIFLGIFLCGCCILCAYIGVRRYQLYDLKGRANVWNVVKDTCCCRSFDDTHITVYKEIRPSRKEHKLSERFQRMQWKIDKALENEAKDLRALTAHLDRSKQLRRGMRNSLEEAQQLITSV
ncbi:fibropellin-1-like [Paramacrobiotus metropolitanus]|uniref:fibropellin-1-like n=1 Tax=Paramacrobiotus metropolitanus TaxID=2943436 RepID=UPI0024464CD4|nr:fibropellin-1-like [Paramacrobiotus metropolitanus]